MQADRLPRKSRRAMEPYRSAPAEKLVAQVGDDSDRN